MEFTLGFDTFSTSRHPLGASLRQSSHARAHEISLSITVCRMNPQHNKVNRSVFVLAKRPDISSARRQTRAIAVAECSRTKTRCAFVARLNLVENWTDEFTKLYEMKWHFAQARCWHGILDAWETCGAPWGVNGGPRVFSPPTRRPKVNKQDLSSEYHNHFLVHA